MRLVNIVFSQSILRFLFNLAGFVSAENTISVTRIYKKISSWGDRYESSVGSKRPWNEASMKQYQLCVLSSVGEAVLGSAWALLSLAVVKLISLYPILTWKKDYCVQGRIWISVRYWGRGTFLQSCLDLCHVNLELCCQHQVGYGSRHFFCYPPNIWYIPPHAVVCEEVV